MIDFKPLLILLFFFFSQIILAQTNFIRGYNKGWAEGSCYDKVGCVAPPAPAAPAPGYNESNDSYKDGYLRGLKQSQAEPDRKTNYNPKPTNFGEYYQPIDIELVQKVLAKKEANFGSNIGSRNSYQDKKDWVNREIHPLLKKFVKNQKKDIKQTLKKSKQLSNKNKNKNLVDINTLSDGWYNAISRYLNQDGILINLNRFAYIRNKKIVQYLGKNNLIYPVTDFKKAGYIYMFKYIEPGGLVSSNSEILIYDKKPLTKLPESEEPHLFMFYTNNISAGDIRIYIKNESLSGMLQGSFYGSPKCSEKKNVVRLLLKPGKYKYFAFDKIHFWEGEINVTNKCSSLRLYER